MIFDGILAVVNLLLQVLLSPLEVINIGIDIAASIPVVKQFLNIVAYVIPWSNIIPIVIIIFGILGIKIIISLLKTLWDVLPLL